ncbi:conserved hypothetical protein [Nostocoides australiense Ben110]|uniref:Coenzyme PQQ synthesis protein D (PqqD) n=1 Tax=Nostocoides australiense Ben110 TaxID=1193182 RepID=W6JUV8_9MICO|nr:conserved hypothetical protein [Tetrasphaera australiensis Ben110]
MTGDSRVYRRAGCIDAVWLVDRFVLFDDRDAVVHELNPAASRVWDLLDGAATVADVARTLSRATGVDAIGDIREFVDWLAGRGMITDVRDAGSGAPESTGSA